ncbi:NUDIX domain-containing protein (plasmid) [Bacillus mycoides]|uniref:NUDIX hydrolase n=1 Tax=Bacillus cereus group TaxID=86661 RepID=UPI0018F6CF53|nr:MULTISPECIES: NUDIX domain-containing protein [Bacillus cereus group]MBJ8095583.1 NUDIX domain-containing protein [Bacillus cereus]QWG36490.1 NUDIX domain-containing protein [Bacillus mycoides]QWG47902.1 NUDIX domain-containing protein [Bacillus mycoides]QWH15039.1 NUDIX domain-containing protein [Bacillus mycoides]
MIRKIGAAILKDNQLLVVSKKKSPDYYMLPGGKLEDGETDLEALRRELQEELQLEVLSSTLLGDFETQSMLGTESMFLTVYVVKIKGEPTPDNEIGAYKWVPIDTQESEYLGTGITKFTLPALRKEITVCPK